MKALLAKVMNTVKITAKYQIIQKITSNRLCSTWLRKTMMIILMLKSNCLGSQINISNRLIQLEPAKNQVPVTVRNQ